MDVPTNENSLLLLVFALLEKLIRVGLHAGELLLRLQQPKWRFVSLQDYSNEWELTSASRIRAA